MDRNLIVVDNFLDAPDYIRNLALTEFEYTKYDKHVPGVRSSNRASGEYETGITKRFEEIFNAKIKWNWNNDTFHFQSCDEDTETWVHRDIGSQWAAVLYLTPDAPFKAGTSIYHRVDIRDYAEDIRIGNVYNRLVAYRGDIMYHRSTIPGFGNSIETSRLTQVFFFDIEPNG
jgi:hypothetical protein